MDPKVGNGTPVWKLQFLYQDARLKVGMWLNNNLNCSVNYLRCASPPPPILRFVLDPSPFQMLHTSNTWFWESWLLYNQRTKISIFGFYVLKLWLKWKTVQLSRTTFSLRRDKDFLNSGGKGELERNGKVQHRRRSLRKRYQRSWEVFSHSCQGDFFL